jgi:hypothetical protein
MDLRGRKWQEVGEDCIMRASILVSFAKYCVIKSRRVKWTGNVARMG